MARFVGLRLPEEKPKKNQVSEKKPDEGSVTVTIAEGGKVENPKEGERKK